MILKLQNIKHFIRSIKHNNINQINLKVKTDKINIVVNKIKTYDYILNHNPNYKKLNNSKNSNENSSSKQKENEEITEKFTGYSTIISPMVGTFYRSPAPNEPPFIEKNDIVNQKQIVCIIEAMKLMNEIETEVSGEIIEILVKDGDIVDCGQALMTVKNP
uniref:Biotin carboxyl carrier protein of acetyl-CoA carboxylase n=1 Tax=Dasyclonium flaccidum TaxID=2007274 RepID=A0A1Z1MKP2_9FLOR|nr:acetyl-CoA carboxylase biotin carboxyl carrier protein [Dasyclonium flaccidum]ARW66657.1 acetyl-CoA carboxylase biotin carboxyl carrier protein [Dasyclonium flaccidum]